MLHMPFPTHRMCVRAVGTEGKGDGWIEDAKLPYHLLHTSDGALLVCVRELDHQAGGSTLRSKGNKTNKKSVKRRHGHSNWLY